MNRREFTRVLGLSAIALGSGGVHAIGGKSRQQPQISITMDDFWWENSVRLTGAQRNTAILSTLSAHKIKAALFVVGRTLEKDEGKKLLAAWDNGGHLIGNHTYSHRNYATPEMTVDEFANDIMRAESMLKTFPRFQKYLRFPALKEGETVAKRDGLRSFLAQQGYRMGYVTIDNSDWIIEARLVERLRGDPKADVKRYRDYYLQHMWDRAQYYEALGRRVAGRAVPHTILTHFNLLNALFLNDLIEMFKSKGWQWIDAETAFADPIFSSLPKIIPAGESIVWALAKENGTIPMSQRYPAEDGESEMARIKKLGL
ncbi:MAG TPA: polysaccharide deacetylase family protein [Pyrinomonadaceae bacterium]|nr:polysaccharide deacetylase family protein [Pyrinomonadaceae bacterium]